MSRTAIIPSKIISLLRKHHLLTPAQILQALNLEGSKVNKTSIYRAIDKLLTSGQICKQRLNESEFMYELRENHHDHAVCTKCNKIVIVDCNNQLKAKLPGFKIDHHHTVLYGLCKSCSK